ncbi:MULTISPECIES: TonB-dependent receptor domain-containing protein [Shewanella]|uniref:TonB-dependent receptor domain-containing protein n=1 Tax=Shewanella TaxID=22 RepID=UPI000B49997D|nr:MULTISPECIES: TonB-dependent receptor [unclassified Shewanella]QYJ70011.1 TonB-dependent receptor [Shewanella sp. FJAT-51649]
MHKNNFLAKSVRFALIGGVAATALNVPLVMAADEVGADKVERIEVTGSRLKRTDLETATPVTTVTSEQIASLGVQDIGEFLQSTSVMSGSPIATTTNNGGNGDAYVELRGLGASRTLVLINGRRPVSSDMQGIPASMIERVEILKDGASATYGADAVAGVVNIITKRDFDGVEFNAQTKQNFDVSAGEQTSFSLLAGKKFDSGHFVVNLDYVKQDEVYQGDVTDIDFFQHPWNIDDPESFAQNGLIPPGRDGANAFDAGSSIIPCGNFFLFSQSGSFTNGTCRDNGDVGSGVATLSDMRKYSGATDTYNYNPVNYLQTPYEKINFYVDGSVELNDSVTVYSETRINKRNSRQELAAVPFNTGTDPGYTVINPTTGIASNGVSKDNYYNPFGEDVRQARRRMIEGGRSFEQDVLRAQQVIGTEIALNDTWSLDVNYNYGIEQIQSTDFGQLYGPNLAKALGPSFEDANGNIVCGTADNPIADCVSLNLFGGAGSITQEMLDYITSPLVDTSKYTLDTFTAFLGGDIFDLPAGSVSGGFGYEYRSEKLVSQVDSGKYMGQVSGNKGQGTSGSFYVNSLFAEFRVPLLEGLPGVERLEMPVGIRYDNFNTFGGATTYQAGLEWAIFDGLLARSTYGTVFRAPTISNLYSPGGDSFNAGTDPCRINNWSNLTADAQARCMADGVPAGGLNNDDQQQLAKVGGNPELEPEEGDTFTVGVAYSPDFIEGLGLTLDYWAVDIDNVITAIDPIDSLDACYIGGLDTLCQNVNRKSDGSIDYIEARNTNLARMTAKGVDFEANYALETGFGDFSFNFVWTHFLERGENSFETTEMPDGTVEYSYGFGDVAGTFINDTSYAKDKWNFTTAYKLDDLTVTYRTNYISSMTYQDLTYWTKSDLLGEYGYLPTYKIPSVMYHDLTASYAFKTNTTVTLGVTNLFNEKPPYIETGFNANTDESTYRLFGRSWFLNLNQKF